MAKRNGAVHVATTTRRYKDKVYHSYLLRRTFREGNKVKHETLGNLSHLPIEIIELIRQALRGEVFQPASKSFEILRSLPHGHAACVTGMMRKLSMDSLLASRASAPRSRALALIASRILDPGSKSATFRTWSQETATNTLGEIFGVKDIAEKEIYEALDWLGSRQKRIESKLAGKHLKEGVLILYDLSSSYYTGKHCDLAKYGYNRDRKKGFPQINYGLICNRDGCPISIEVFPGNISDTKTLQHQIRKIRNRFGLRRFVLVGDRGMITQARIDDELKDVEGIDWITALRSSSIKKLIDTGAIQLSLFDEKDLVEIRTEDYPGERLVVCRNPSLAEERARHRQALLDATEKELQKIVIATERTKRPFRGKEKIIFRASRVLNRYKVKKHFILHFEEDAFSFHRNQEKIDAEAALDGLYVVRSSLNPKEMSSEELVGCYKELSKVENAFRSMKTIDLQIRPIFHRLDQRVKAHIFLCMLAYYVQWHMRRLWAPILFQEENFESARQRRKSIVSKARRSVETLKKIQSKKTSDGGPVHSFQTVLKDMATITYNQVQIPLPASNHPAPPFYQMTQPTPFQKKALELLGVSLAL